MSVGFCRLNLFIAIKKKTAVAMRNQLFKQCVIGAIVLMCAGSTSVLAQVKDVDYIKEREQQGVTPMRVAGETDLGWSFYYPDEVEPELKEEPKVIPPPATQPSKPLTPMSVEWFAQNYELIRNRAVDNPSRENLRAELYAQKVMMDKSEVFARKRQYMQQTDPLLQESDRLPLFGATSLAMIQHQKAAKSEALDELFEQSGLMVFYDENCQYCRQSIIIINYLSKKYPGLDIRVYARNTAQPDFVQNLLPNIKVYPDDLIKVSERLQITNWPSYVLVTPDDTFTLLAKGMVSFDTLTNRTLIAGFEHGVLGQEWYERIHHTQMGLIASNEYGSLPEGMEQDPVLLINSVIDMIQKSNGQSFYNDFYAAPQGDER